jgi:hypothetical protein
MAKFHNNRKKDGRSKMFTPEILKGLFNQYKNQLKSTPHLLNGITQDCTILQSTTERPYAYEEFEAYVIENTKAKGIDQYFTNQGGAYKEFSEVCTDIKSEIFNNKITLYKSGGLHYSKICKELHDRGITFDDIGNHNLKKTIPGEFPYQSCKEGITIKDSYLKKIPNQAKNMAYKKPPNEIYVINIKGSNIYKIGVSSNSQRRIFDLRAANPFPIDVIYVQKSLFPAQLERKIHNHLSDKHIKNEWFKIDDIDIVLGIIKKG